MNIQKTTEYSKFRYFKSNRETFINNLLKSVQEKNMLHAHPIIVNKDFFVIDGQHRLEVAKKLQVPIYYIVVEDINEEHIPQNQVQRVWMLDDYLNFYKEKINDYKEIDRLRKEYALDTNVLITLTSTGMYKTAMQRFRRGQYQQNKNIENIDNKLKHMTEIRQIIRPYGNSSVKDVIRAIWKLINQPNYDNENMIKKLQFNPDGMIEIFKYKHINNIYQVLVDIYNRNLQEKKRIE